MTTKKRNIILSGEIASRLNIDLVDKEFNYGKGIGKADNYCLLNNWIIIVEIEYSQRHPEMNVLKAWPFLEADSKRKVYIIQHIIDSSKVSKNRVELCQWVGKKMKYELKDRFGYYLIKNDYKHSDQETILNQMKALKIK